MISSNKVWLQYFPSIHDQLYMISLLHFSLQLFGAPPALLLEAASFTFILFATTPTNRLKKSVGHIIPTPQVKLGRVVLLLNKVLVLFEPILLIFFQYALDVCQRECGDVLVCLRHPFVSICICWYYVCRGVLFWTVSMMLKWFLVGTCLGGQFFYTRL